MPGRSAIVSLVHSVTHRTLARRFEAGLAVAAIGVLVMASTGKATASEDAVGGCGLVLPGEVAAVVGGFQATCGIYVIGNRDEVPDSL